MSALITVEGDQGHADSKSSTRRTSTPRSHASKSSNRRLPRLENAATQVVEHYLAHFATRDWAAIAETLADDFYIDDRRRVVNAGIRIGRDAEVEDLQAAADVGLTLTMSGVIATRGDRLALTRVIKARVSTATRLDSNRVPSRR